MRKLQLPWGKIAYSDSAGDGFPIVFLHGTGCDSGDWKDVVAALPAWMRIILIDFRGHGESDACVDGFTINDLASDVLAVADHLCLSRAALAGHSLGGMAAMLVAEHSGMAAGLVLLEGWTNNRACEAYSGERTYGRLGDQAVARIKQKHADMAARFSPEALRCLEISAGMFDAYSYLERAGIPIVEVYGGAGRKNGTESLLRIPENSRISIVWIPGVGHYVPHEAPGDVADICARAIAGML